jgi:hypothetical protein
VRFVLIAFLRCLLFLFVTFVVSFVQSYLSQPTFDTSFESLYSTGFIDPALSTKERHGLQSLPSFIQAYRTHKEKAREEAKTLQARIRGEVRASQKIAFKSGTWLAYQHQKRDFAPMMALTVHHRASESTRKGNSSGTTINGMSEEAYQVRQTALSRLASHRKKQSVTYSVAGINEDIEYLSKSQQLNVNPQLYNTSQLGRERALWADRKGTVLFLAS